MAFNFGQIRKNSNINYINHISSNIQEEPKIMTIASLDRDVTFINKVINTSLSSSKSYFIRLKFFKQETEQKITLKIEDRDALIKGSQIIGTITVPAGSPFDSYVYEKVFMPLKDYNRIYLELERTNNDYALNQDRNDNTYGRIINIEVVTCAEIKNLLLDNIIRLGVQGTPGLLMSINGEQIKIGNSGIFEINIDYLVSYFGVVIEENDNKFFIADYQQL